jgi:hypothetical protein
MLVPIRETANRAEVSWLRARLPFRLAVTTFLTLLATSSFGQQGLNSGVITGSVLSGHGPEAGVWVIAETDDLPTHFTKIVVTDDQGRFVLPEMPDVQFKVWVRGYGLLIPTQSICVLELKMSGFAVSLRKTLC